MVRVGGMGYRIDPRQPIGSRISEMTLLASGEPIDPARDYVVAGWASVNEGTEGPPVWDVVEAHLQKNPVVHIEENQSVQVARSEERRVGKECVRTCRSRRSPYH